MRVIDVAPVPDAGLPVAEFSAHLRLGTGFASDGLQEEMLRGQLRAALATVEGRIGKILILRDFQLELDYWRDPACVPLPLAPVAEISEVSVQGPEGPPVIVPPGRWRLLADMQRPKLVSRRVSLPAVPEGGKAVITLRAGFGAWAGLPADLRQAVLMLAAQFYEIRHDGGGATGGALPFGVAALIERWRSVRVLAGGS